MKMTMLSCLLPLGLALPVIAADATGNDVNGTWECGLKGADGAIRPLVATLKVDGSKLTGVLKGINSPDIDLFDGKIEGDRLSWSSKRPVQGGTVQFNYSGTATAEGLQLTVARADGQGPAMNCTAKRGK